MGVLSLDWFPPKIQKHACKHECDNGEYLLLAQEDDHKICQNYKKGQKYHQEQPSEYGGLSLAAMLKSIELVSQLT